MSKRGSVLLEALACVVVVGIGSTYIMQSFRAQQVSVVAQRDQAVVLTLLEERIGKIASGMTLPGDIPAKEDVPQPLDKCSFESAPGESMEEAGNGLSQVSVAAACPSGKNTRRLKVDLVMAEKTNDASTTP
ncbi:MAG: hypothetical protein HQL22_01210 [Candidatus Omnitrophica bacterium]|nr:hypothetical protein [Candidatus Omnitrophota bacterium]